MTPTEITINQLTAKLIEPNKYKVCFKDKPIGDFTQDVDGYFYFEFEPIKGYWTAWFLQNIASLLNEVNKPLENLIKQKLK